MSCLCNNLQQTEREISEQLHEICQQLPQLAETCTTFCDIYTEFSNYLIRTFLYLNRRPETGGFNRVDCRFQQIFSSLQLRLCLSLCLCLYLLLCFDLYSCLPGPGQPHASSNDAQLKAENADAAKKRIQLRCRCRLRRLRRRRCQLNEAGVCSALGVN